MRTGKRSRVFDGIGDGPPGQRHFDFVLNIFHRNAVAGGFLALDVDLHVAFAHDRRGDDIACAVDRLECGFDIFAHLVDRFQIGAKHLDADVGAHAGRQHIDAVDDRLGEDVAPAGHLQHAEVHFVVDQIALGTRRVAARRKRDREMAFLTRFAA